MLSDYLGGYVEYNWFKVFEDKCFEYDVYGWWIWKFNGSYFLVWRV